MKSQTQKLGWWERWRDTYSPIAKKAAAAELSNVRGYLVNQGISDATVMHAIDLPAIELNAVYDS